MGTASIVLGLVGVCICWVPGLGWLGALAGLLGCAFGIPSITHWFHKPGYTPWGISGIISGVASADLSLAYQIKYAEGALDSTILDVAPVAAVGISLFCAMLCAAGLVIARKKNRPAGILVTAAALAAMIAVGTSALVTADKQYEADRSHTPDVK